MKSTLKITKEEEKSIFYSWYKIAMKGFVSDELVANFFEYYEKMENLGQNQKAFHFWHQGFRDIIKQTSSKSEEIQKLKENLNYLLSEVDAPPNHSNLINCARIMTTNCFRTRLNKKIATTGEYEYNEPIFNDVREGFNAADISIAIIKSRDY